MSLTLCACRAVGGLLSASPRAIRLPLLKQNQNFVERAGQSPHPASPAAGGLSQRFWPDELRWKSAGGIPFQLNGGSATRPCWLEGRQPCVTTKTRATRYGRRERDTGSLSAQELRASCCRDKHFCIDAVTLGPHYWWPNKRGPWSRVSHLEEQGCGSLPTEPLPDHAQSRALWHLTPRCTPRAAHTAGWGCHVAFPEGLLKCRL